MDPENLHMCLMCSCRALYEWGLIFRCVSLEMWDPLGPKYPKKKRKQVSAEKKEKNNIR